MTYPSATSPGYIYYRRDDGWWKRHTDEAHADAERVLLLDVLISVDDTQRAAIRAEHEQAMDNAITLIHSDIREGHRHTMRTHATRLSALADDQLSVLVVERAR